MSYNPMEINQRLRSEVCTKPKLSCWDVWCVNGCVGGGHGHQDSERRLYEFKLEERAMLVVSVGIRLMLYSLFEMIDFQDLKCSIKYKICRKVFVYFYYF